jgi:hypothetical protein
VNGLPPTDSDLEQVPPAYRAAAAAVRAEFAARPDVQAVLLAGSVLRGEGGPTSDLDVWVISDTPDRRRHNRIIAGVPVEIFVNSPAWIAHYLAEGDNSAMHMISTGLLVYVRADAAAAVDALRERVLAVYAQGPAALSAEALARHRSFLVDAWWDVQDVCDTDPPSATLAMTSVLNQALVLYYAERQAWRPKPKRLLADLAARDPALAAVVRAYLAADDLAARRAALESILAAPARRSPPDLLVLGQQPASRPWPLTRLT